MELKIIMLAWYINVHACIHKHTHICIYEIERGVLERGWELIEVNGRTREGNEGKYEQSAQYNAKLSQWNLLFCTLICKQKPPSILSAFGFYMTMFFIFFFLCGKKVTPSGCPPSCCIKMIFCPILYLSITHPEGAHGKSVLRNLGTYKPDRSRVSLSLWHPCMVPSGHPEALSHVYSFCSPKSMRVKIWLHLRQLST